MQPFQAFPRHTNLAQIKPLFIVIMLTTLSSLARVQQCDYTLITYYLHKPNATNPQQMHAIIACWSRAIQIYQTPQPLPYLFHKHRHAHALAPINATPLAKFKPFWPGVVLDNARLMKKDICIIYIDFGNVFGSINQGQLLVTMLNLGYLGDTIKIVGNLYTKATTSFHGLTFENTCPIHIHKGTTRSRFLSHN